MSVERGDHKKGGGKKEYDPILLSWQLVPKHSTAPDLEAYPHHSHQNTKRPEFPGLPSAPTVPSTAAGESHSHFKSRQAKFHLLYLSEEYKGV